MYLHDNILHFVKICNEAVRNRHFCHPTNEVVSKQFEKYQIIDMDLHLKNVQTVDVHVEVILYLRILVLDIAIQLQ